MTLCCALCCTVNVVTTLHVADALQCTSFRLGRSKALRKSKKCHVQYCDLPATASGIAKVHLACRAPGRAGANRAGQRQAGQMELVRQSCWHTDAQTHGRFCSGSCASRQMHCGVGSYSHSKTGTQTHVPGQISWQTPEQAAASGKEAAQISTESDPSVDIAACCHQAKH